MNHYCTYFDAGFAIQGLALWRSLAKHDPEAVLWVLALDETAAAMLAELGDARLRVVPLARLEADDAELAATRANRTRVEYFFTVSPCWPIWLLTTHAEIGRVTYLDADLFFFASPAPIFAAMDAARASVLVTAHRFPAWLRHYERHGKFNVGVLSFRNDAVGRSCLDDWRARCLAWCYDRVEGDRYADQKYLEAWPRLVGRALLVLEHAGVNAAPWNWAGARWSGRTVRGESEGGAEAGGDDDVGDVMVEGVPLVVFHFARFRALAGGRRWESGQLDYGIMPRRLRAAIYGPYVAALHAARAEWRGLGGRWAEWDFPQRAARGGREFWRTLPWRVVFGGVWVRRGGEFWNLRAGLGQWSGRAMAWTRRIAGRE